MGISSINGRLVSSLTGISGTKNSATKAIQLSGNTEAATNRIKIRDTSDTFARAAGKISSAGSYLQQSKEIISDLLEIVDKTIKVVDKSAKAGTSESQRRQLDKEFAKQQKEFDKLVEEAKLNGVDLLSKEGLESILELAGLSPEKSASIAKVFASFSTSKNGDELVDTSSRPQKKVIPASVQPPTPTETFVRTKISRNTDEDTPGPVFAHTGGAIFQDDDDPTFQTAPGTDTAVFVNEIRSTQAVDALTFDARVLAVSEQSGYTVIESAQDFFGYNPGGMNQLYLLDKEGTPLMQLTEFAFGIIVESADVSSDGLKVAFVASDDFLGTNPDMSDDVYLSIAYEIDPGGIGSRELYNISDLSEGSNVISGVKISESGKYILFDGTGELNATGESLNGFVIYNTEKGSSDTSAASSSRRALAVDSNGLSYTIVRSTKEIYSYAQDTGENIEFEPGKFSTLHYISEDGKLGFKDNSGVIKYADLTQDATDSGTTVYAPQSGDSITRLSISNTSSGDVRVVATGTIVANEPIVQAYMFETYEQNVKTNSNRADSVSKVFDYSLRNRANAIRALEDLKDIKKQLGQNLTALESGMEAVKANLEISIAMSQSLAEVSQTERIDNADKIAEGIRKKILTYGVSSQALNQITNLDEIAAAAVLA
jgi:hypothetical protein